jgi:hypothetical protein
MSTVEAAQIAPRKKSYDRYRIRRHVRRDAPLPDGITPFVTKSFTQDDENIEWHPHVDTRTGEVWCDCPDFRFRHAPTARRNNEIPNVLQVEYHCKHVIRAVANCVRRGEIQLPATSPKAPQRDMTPEERAESLRMADELL